MTNSAIQSYPIQPIAVESPIDQALAEALLSSVGDYHQSMQGHRIWLACSGGRDSLALAALCLQLYRKGELPFLPQLLHVDHNLQAHSQEWANHVAQWAEAQQLPCTILQAHVEGKDEQAARLARYQAMLNHMNQGDVLLLAHHADDQAETLLMRLIQGAGVKGLAAMQAWREQVQGERHNILWRPWLLVRRKTISAYAQRLQLPFIDDPTNNSGDNLRSNLRNNVMPLLATYNPNVVENIARSALLLSDAQATVTAQAEQDWQHTCIKELCLDTAQQVLDIDKLATLPIYRQRQLLHFWLSKDEPLPPTKQLVDDVLALTQRQDNDHQTQLAWYAQRQRYSIRRHRQQLYRLSHAWLDWLALPVVEQTQGIFIDNLAINLRASADYIWQLSVASDKLASLLTSKKDKLVIKITPLTRQQKVRTQLATRAQSGKKLYQTLAIPVWLRDSLMIVSIESTSVESKQSLLLISPFESWMLTRDVERVELVSFFNNVLQINN